MCEDDPQFRATVAGLLNGDFSRLAPLFESKPSPIVTWHEQGCFKTEPKALDEALTCACFNGATEVASYLLDRGLDPSGGNNTGMNAIHWAANRGQLEAVNLLLARKVPLETKNAYDGTALSCAVWSAQNEPKPQRLEIIQALVAAGSNKSAVSTPTGDAEIDRLLS